MKTRCRVQRCRRPASWCLWEGRCQPPVSSETAALWLVNKVAVSSSGSSTATLSPAAPPPGKGREHPGFLYPASTFPGPSSPATSRRRLLEELKSELDVSKSPHLFMEQFSITPGGEKFWGLFSASGSTKFKLLLWQPLLLYPSKNVRHNNTRIHPGNSSWQTVCCRFPLITTNCFMISE